MQGADRGVADSPAGGRLGRRAPRWGLAVLAALLVGCGSARMPREMMEDLWRQALEDTRMAEASEIVSDLPRLLPEEAGSGEPRLRWRGLGRERRLAVVAWMSDPPGRAGRTVTLGEAVWVVPHPWFEERCRSIDSGKEELVLRLAQLLGLPPRPRGRRFVEMWVRPKDLFRPCPDPETDDGACELSPPAPGPSLHGGDPYRRWFAAQYESSYQRGERAWTRLGYTYDWGSPWSEVGLPELVVWPGAEVEVEAVLSSRAYCGRR